MHAYTIRNFIKGTITRLEPQSIPDGASPDSLNFVTKGDKVELRRGTYQLGTDAGAGRVSGLAIATRIDGTQVLFKTHARKVSYFDEATSDWIENGTDVLPAAADGEDISLAPYANLAGAQLLISSPNSSIYKIMVANPGSITDLLSTTFRGYIKAIMGRVFLWNQQGTTAKDPTNPYGSYIDRDEISDYTQISAEAIGAAGSLTYPGTLAFKGAGAKRTCFFVTFTDGVESFSDDYNGNLVGSAGGTGTINYTTGAYSVTFAALAAGSVTSTYYWEDSTSQGVADFSKSTPRTAGQGFRFLQTDGGGPLLGIAAYQDGEYCLHLKKTWKITLTNTDTAATNLPYRDKVGIPYWRAYCETGDGIYYVDDVDENDPHIRLLTLNAVSAEVIPVSLSSQLDLSGYEFDTAAVFEYGTLILVACKTAGATANNRVLAYDRALKTWDIHDWSVACFAIYNGVLLGGDSVTNNVYELFSGLDDDDSNISGHWDLNISRLGLPGLKKAKRLRLQGEIGPDQHANVYFSPDKSARVLVGTIDGDATYVDRSQRISVGASTLGRSEVGGGGTDGQIPAYNYRCEIRLNSDKFDWAQLRFEPTGIGYFSVSEITFHDIRVKESMLPAAYR
jgi:hypothetical protein